MSPRAKPRADGTESGSNNVTNEEPYSADGVEHVRESPCTAHMALRRLNSEVQLLVREHGERLTQRLEAWTQRLEDVDSLQRDMPTPRLQLPPAPLASSPVGYPTSTTSAEPSRDPQDLSSGFLPGPRSAATPPATPLMTSEADLCVTLKLPKAEPANGEPEEFEVARAVSSPPKSLTTDRRSTSERRASLSPRPWLNQVSSPPPPNLPPSALPGALTPASMEDSLSCRQLPSMRVKAENGDLLPSISGRTVDEGVKTTPSSMDNSRAEKKKLREEMMRNLQLSKTKKFKTDRKHADDYLLPGAREAAEQYESALEKVVTSVRYEWASIILIIANSAMIGIQTWLQSKDAVEAVKAGRTPEQGELWEIRVVEMAFCIVFSVDLLLRWYVDGLIEFFQTKDWAWNIFDTVIISCNGIELILDLTGYKQSVGGGFSSLRVLRIIRMVRVLRVIRVMRFFRELRMMLHSLMGSLKALMWAVLVFLMIFYVFGIAFTMAVYEESCKWSDKYTDEEQEEFDALIKDFGTLDRSCISLFMGITGGKDWGEFYDVLAVLPSMNRYLYVVFITFSIVAALNVVTGVFVENAMRSSEKDKEFVIQEEMNFKEQYMLEMRCLFEEMDTTNSGCLSLAEFKEHLDDDRAVAYFNALELDFEQAEHLFMLLDVDNSGAVDFEEFLDGCEKLKGEARSIDLAMLHYEMKWLTQGIYEFRDKLVECIESPK